MTATGQQDEYIMLLSLLNPGDHSVNELVFGAVFSIFEKVLDFRCRTSNKFHPIKIAPVKGPCSGILPIQFLQCRLQIPTTLFPVWLYRCFEIIGTTIALLFSQNQGRLHERRRGVLFTSGKPVDDGVDKQS